MKTRNSINVLQGNEEVNISKCRKCKSNFETRGKFLRLCPKCNKRKQTHPEVLSIEEVKMLAGGLPKPYDLAIKVLYNFGAGLRVGEMIKLRWNNINFFQWYKKAVDDPNSKHWGTCHIIQGKGGKDRWVQVPYSMMNDLIEYARGKGLHPEFNVCNNRIFYFSTAWNFKKMQSPLWKEPNYRSDYFYFRRKIRDIGSKIIGRRLYPHLLRHSKATILYNSNVRIEEIKELLGHSNIETTMIYTHISPEKIMDSAGNKGSI